MAFITSPYYVYVNSADRISGTNANFTYNVALPEDHNFTHVTVLDALIPKSYYLIQDGADTFQLTEDSTTVTISLTHGNYLLNAWTTTLTSALNTNSPNGWTYTVTYPTPTGADQGKLIYTVTGNSSEPSITVSSALYEPFGFASGTTNTFTSGSLTSSTVIKLQSEDRLLIHSDMINNPNNDNVLFAVNAGNVVPYSSISYVNYAPDYNTHELKSRFKNSISISLLNESGVIQQLNGLNMNITLMFYKKEDPMELMKKFIQLIVSKK